MKVFIKEQVKKILAFAPLFLPFLLFIVRPAGYPYPSSKALFSDFTITHLPIARFIHESFAKWGQLPLWSDSILSGYPLVAHPLSGFWYPFSWMTVVFPSALVFNVTVAFHLVWAGFGMYSLIRSEGLSHKAGILAGLGFSLMPKVIAHYGAGHITLIYAISWIPWLLNSVYKKPIYGIRGSWGLVLALITLADVRLGIYAGGLWLAYFIRTKVRGDRRKSVEAADPFKITPWGVWRSHIKQGLVFLLLIAPLALPLLQFTAQTTRSEMTPQDSMSYSLPMEKLIGLFFPDVGGNQEWITYFGSTFLVLLTLSFFDKQLREKVKFWWILVIACFTLSLGSSIPGVQWLVRLPILNLLRVPTRSLLLAGLGMSAIAAAVLDAFVEPVDREEKEEIRKKMALIGLIGFVSLISIAIQILTQKWMFPLIWGTLMTSVVIVWILLGWNRPSLLPGAWIGILLFTCVDLLIVDAQMFYRYPVDRIDSTRDHLIQVIKQTPDPYFRVYSPSYSLPQQVAQEKGIELVDGVDPMQLKAYAEFMRRASGVKSQGYSVTIPPYKTGTPSIDNQDSIPNLYLLGLLNTRYIAADFMVKNDELVYLGLYDQVYLYQNPYFLPRAWIQSYGTELGSDIQPVDSIEWSPNLIRIHVNQPGLLVLSEIAYPGWVVEVDGVHRPVNVVAGILRGVDIQPGDAEIVFKFIPLTFYGGLALAVLAGMIMIIKPTFRMMTGLKS